jgi:hypothetical protein
MEAQKDEVLHLDGVALGADLPAAVCIFLLTTTFVFLSNAMSTTTSQNGGGGTYIDEPLNTFCDVLRKLDPSDGFGWAPEIFCRNLTAPL